jgi:hypothetical protein
LASFKVVSERNIFNTNRRPRSGPPLKKPVKIESFSLRGTLQDEAANTAYAFFGGSESRYNAVCKLGETIAGYKVLEIQPDSVKLETNEMRIDLPIGMQMRRQDEGAWQVIVGVAASSAGESHSPPSPSSDRFSRGDRGPGAQPSDRYARNDRSYGSQPSDRFSRGDRGFGGPPSDRFSRGDRSQGSDGGRSGRRGRISTTAGETEFQAEVLDGVATVAAASSASSPSSATSASSSGSSDTAGLSADEILKRLMQKREQEMNR